jgi:capsular polysaccharide biosynthesis protein
MKSGSEVWQFSDLRYVLPVHIPPAFKLPAAIQRLRTLILEAMAAPTESAPSSPRRMYLSRRDAGVRGVVDEGELVELLARFGFNTTCPSGVPPLQQARLFSEADAIIGAKGAALANIVFCQPRWPVMVLSPDDFPDPFYLDIAGQPGLRYGEVSDSVTTSRPSGLNDFLIDTVAVARMLGAVLGPEAVRPSPVSTDR